MEEMTFEELMIEEQLCRQRIKAHEKGMEIYKDKANEYMTELIKREKEKKCTL